MPSSSSAAEFVPSASLPASPPSPTAEACAELAAFTVRIFTPTVVGSVREIFAQNQRLDLDEHLPLLGTLVVRHVALMLQDDGLNHEQEDDDDESPQSPVLEKHDRRIKNEDRVDLDALRDTPSVRRRLHRESKRRSSYRDIAYNAVRQKRIVPESVPVERDDSKQVSTAQTRPVRRLSIRSFRLPKDAAMRKTKSIAAIDPRNALHENTNDPKKSDDKVVKRRHSPSFWKDDAPKHNFPRAGVSSSIQSPSTSGLKAATTAASQERKENRTRGGSSPSSKGNGRSPPMSRLAQLRKQRLEKRGKPIR